MEQSPAAVSPSVTAAAAGRPRAPAHLGSVLMMGVVSQLAQVVLLRELLMLFHGNELSIGIILAAWMAWVGIGSAVGTMVAGRTERVLAVMAANACVLLPVLVGTVLIIRGMRGLFNVVPGAYLTLVEIVAASAAVLAPVGLLIGMQFVLLAKLWRQHDRSEDTQGAAKTYIGEAVGNIAGGMAFSLLLVHYLNALEIMVIVGVGVALAVLWAGRRGAEFGDQLRPSARIVVGLLILVGIVAFGWLGRADDFGHRLQWRQLAPDHELLEVRQSKHGNIAIARLDDQLSFYRSGHLMFAAAGPLTGAPHFEEQDAARFAHFGLTQHPAPRRVLLIGGGLRGTLAEVLKHPVEQVDYVELDEVLTHAARVHLGAGTLAALEAPRVNLVHRDGRLFIKEARAQWDVILVDVPDPATAVLNRYYTREFFEEVAARLAQDGLLVIGAVSTPGLRGRAVANRNATIRHSLGSVFTQVLAAGEQSLIFLASNPASDAEDGISAAPDVLIDRYQQRGIQSAGFSAGHFRLLLEPGQLARVNWILVQHGRAAAAHLQSPPLPPLGLSTLEDAVAGAEDRGPVAERFFINSDFRPIGYFHTLMFWGDLTGSGSADQLAVLMRVEGRWVIVPVAMLLVLLGLLRLVGPARIDAPERRIAVGLAVFTTGLSTMAMQVGLLFAFQSIHGFVYEMIGLIVALFMAGLAVGTALTQRYVRDRSSLGLLACVQGLIALFALLIALLVPLATVLPSGPVVFGFFALLTFAGGLLNGIDFPLATEAFRSINRRAERSAGLVYGIELSGACLGAALASAVVAPIMGIVACFLLAAIANGSALAALLIARSRRVPASP